MDVQGELGREEWTEARLCVQRAVDVLQKLGQDGVATPQKLASKPESTEGKPPLSTEPEDDAEERYSMNNKIRSNGQEVFARATRLLGRLIKDFERLVQCIRSELWLQKSLEQEVEQLEVAKAEGIKAAQEGEKDKVANETAALTQEAGHGKRQLSRVVAQNKLLERDIERTAKQTQKCMEEVRLATDKVNHEKTLKERATVDLFEITRQRKLLEEQLNDLSTSFDTLVEKIRNASAESEAHTQKSEGRMSEISQQLEEAKGLGLQRREQVDKLKHKLDVEEDRRKMATADLERARFMQTTLSSRISPMQEQLAFLMQQLDESRERLENAEAHKNKVLADQDISLQEEQKIMELIREEAQREAEKTQVLKDANWQLEQDTAKFKSEVEIDSRLKQSREADMARVGEQYKFAEAELDSCERQGNVIREEMAKVRKQYQMDEASIRQDRKASHEDRDTSQRNLKECCKSIEETEKQLEDLRLMCGREITRLETEIKVNTKIGEDKQKVLNRETEKLKKMNTDVEDAERELETATVILNDYRETFTVQKDALNAPVSRLQSTIDKLQKACDAAPIRVKQLEDRIEEQETRTSGLLEGTEKSEKAIQKLEREIEEINRVIALTMENTRLTEETIKHLRKQAADEQASHEDWVNQQEKAIVTMKQFMKETFSTNRAQVEQFLESQKREEESKAELAAQAVSQSQTEHRQNDLVEVYKLHGRLKGTLKDLRGHRAHRQRNVIMQHNHQIQSVVKTLEQLQNNLSSAIKGSV